MKRNLTSTEISIRVEIKKSLKGKGLGIVDLAKFMNLTRQAIYNKMNGTADFTLNELVRIYDWLEMPIPLFVRV